MDSPSTTEGWVREGDSVHLFCRGDGSSNSEYAFYRLQVMHPIIPLEPLAPDLCDILTCTTSGFTWVAPGLAKHLAGDPGANRTSDP